MCFSEWDLYHTALLAQRLSINGTNSTWYLDYLDCDLSNVRTFATWCPIRESSYAGRDIYSTHRTDQIPNS